MQGTFAVGGGRVQRGNADGLLDRGLLAKLVCIALVNTHTATTQNRAHGSNSEPGNLASQIQVYCVARVTNTKN